jgi:hypothetical protein
VFDISQIEGEPLPELETKATGDAGDLMPTLLDVADELDITHQCWLTDSAPARLKPSRLYILCKKRRYECHI